MAAGPVPKYRVMSRFHGIMSEPREEGAFPKGVGENLSDESHTMRRLTVPKGRQPSTNLRRLFMAKHSTPNWVFSFGDERTTINLVGYKGGLRHSYAKRTLTGKVDKSAIISAITEMGVAAGIDKHAAEGVNGKQWQ